MHPFKATNRTVFTLERIPTERAPKVTWEMTGERTIASTAFGLVMNMDDLVGKDSIEGLDAVAVAVAAKPAAVSPA